MLNRHLTNRYPYSYWAFSFLFLSFSLEQFWNHLFKQYPCSTNRYWCRLSHFSYQVHNLWVLFLLLGQSHFINEFYWKWWFSFLINTTIWANCCAKDLLEWCYLPRFLNHFLFTAELLFDYVKNWLFLFFFLFNFLNKLLWVLNCGCLGLDFELHNFSILRVLKQKSHTAHRIVKIVKFFIEFLIMRGEVVV